MEKPWYVKVRLTEERPLFLFGGYAKEICRDLAETRARCVEGELRQTQTLVIQGPLAISDRGWAVTSATVIQYFVP